MSYLDCLAKSVVTFDQPKWKGFEIESEIVEDFYLIAKSISILSKSEKEKLHYFGDLNFDELRALLIKYGYPEAKNISIKLIDIYSQQNESLKIEIQQMSKQKLLNDASHKLTYMLGMAPSAENTDKILKYERSLQKSIFQNLIMLKKLQEVF